MTLDVAGLGLVGSESEFSDSVWKNLKRAKMSLPLFSAMIFGFFGFSRDLFIHTCSSCNDAIDKLMKNNC